MADTHLNTCAVLS
jgi:hypothetical protein